MTPPVDPASQTSANSLPSFEELLLGVIPPLKAALIVWRSPTPATSAAAQKYSKYGLPLAIALLMAMAIALLVASDGAPFVAPWTSLWTYKFELHVNPSYDWEVLAWCIGYSLGAYVVAGIVTWLIGLMLRRWLGGANPPGVRLAAYAALGALGIYLAAQLLALSAGWILYALNVPVFIFGWLAIAAILALPLATWGIRRLFRRATLSVNVGIIFPLVISTATILSSVLAASFIIEELSDAAMARGREVNVMRSTPMPVIAQNCVKASEDVVCAFSLFPGQWQGYELIGDWRLGAVPSLQAGHQARFDWRLPEEAGRVFGLAKLEAEKDMTLELRTSAARLCTKEGTQLRTDEMFFSVLGRVLGVQRNAPQDLRLRIDNVKGGFVEMVKKACLS